MEIRSGSPINPTGQMASVSGGAQTAAPIVDTVQRGVGGAEVSYSSLSAITRPSAPRRFDELGDQLQGELFEKAQNLASKGMLFSQQGPGQPLQRVDANAVYDSLDGNNGGLVYVVRQTAQQIDETSSSSSQRSFGYSGFGSASDSYNAMRDNSRTQGGQTASYYSTPVMSWESLRWVTPQGQGMDRVDSLPAPVGNTQTAKWYSDRTSRYGHSASGDSLSERSSGYSESWSRRQA